MVPMVQSIKSKENLMNKFLLWKLSNLTKQTKKRLKVFWMKLEFCVQWITNTFVVMKKLFYHKIKKKCVLLWSMLVVVIYRIKLKNAKNEEFNLMKKLFGNIFVKVFLVWSLFIKPKLYIEILKLQIYFWLKISLL